MFWPEKNSYLQLEGIMEPRLINKAVRRAMRKTQIDPHDEIPAAQRLESMQPSLFAPWMDITRARLGFGRLGLRIINRDINSEDSITQLQAIHSLLDQVQISENAMFLIKLNVVYRLIDLMTDINPIIREKVTLCLIHLANYYQGRQRIISRPVIIDHIIQMIQGDRKEIRYVAALCLKTLTRDIFACAMIFENDKIVETLVKMIQNDHMGIVMCYLNALKKLTAYDPTKALKANAFQVMRKLMKFHDSSVVTAATDCMTQLCKHSVGQKLADENDLMRNLQTHIVHTDIKVIISTVGLMVYITQTIRAKWRTKEYQEELTKRLVYLCLAHSVPTLQIRAMQVLINLCDNPDIREHIKVDWLKKIKTIKIRTHEQWDGTSETTTFGLETGHNYRTMCIEGVETIRNDYGDSAIAFNVHSFLRRVQDVKDSLIKAINAVP